jgi:hypothetical protein
MKILFIILGVLAAISAGMVFLLFSWGSKSGYYRETGKWHYDGVPISREKEPLNFQPLAGPFARDEQLGYYRGMAIYDGDEPSDGPSFSVLNTYFAKDKKMVYYCDTERDSKEYWSIRRNKVKSLKAADPETFRLMSDGYTARDKQHLFRRDQIMPVRDLESFVMLEHEFQRDRVRGYYRLAEIAGSDGPSFEALDGHYARDKGRIYFVDGFDVGGVVKTSHRDAFRVLADGYATDGQKAYYRGAVIATRDAESLQELSGLGYAKTRSQVFHNGRWMRDADAETFARIPKFDPRYDATDKSGAFSSGKRVQLP